jgi:hypothetical protein
MSVAIQTVVIRVATVTLAALILVAQAFAPSGDIAIADVADTARPPDASCAAQVPPPQILAPRGNVRIMSPADALRVPCRPNFAGEVSAVR